MDTYTPPRTDMRYVMEVIVGIDRLLADDAFAGVDQETVDMVLDEVGRFMAEVVAPLNRNSDVQGSVWQADGSVVTPDGFVDAYKMWVDTGFNAVPFDPAFGGGGFPWVSAIAIQEMLTSASMSFSLCPLLTQGAIDAIAHHGSDEQKATYLPKMLTGEWTGTMNLTEPQAGSDVGALTSKAEPVGDGSYRISGQKIFITFGEHDMADNIIHLVLARTPGAPPGTRGISMFVVPKYFVNEDGSLGERNDVSCVSIEHKLGIHGSPTCVLSYGENGGAIGWLVGDEGDGMRNMFTMMNNARLSVGLEGLSLAERAFQQALVYAQERLQGTAVGAERGTSSPIIDHADVRRMLMMQRSWIDAMRCLVYTNAAAVDRARVLTGDEQRQAQELLDLLTPLTKGLCTDLGVELTSQAVQVYGGMGYVEETGVAQLFRDSRIAPIYEGTNGIQAADLVARKLPMRGGAVVEEQLAQADQVADALDASGQFGHYGANLRLTADEARQTSQWLLASAGRDLNDVLGGSSPYLRLLATVVCGTLLGQLALDAAARIEAGDGGGSYRAEFLQAKVVSGRFFGEQILPTVAGLGAVVQAGSADLFALDADQLSA